MAKKLKVYDSDGKEVGTYSIDPDALAPRINKQLLHDAVVMYQANQRLGAAKTKTRAEVAGSTRKMYRQKGTGNARAGSRRSGLRRGGGHIFAKRPRDFGYRLPSKAIKAATRMAIASKIIDEQIMVIEDLQLDKPATGEMVTILQALGIGDSSTLLSTAEYDRNIYLSSRNLTSVNVAPVAELNALNVLAPRVLLVTRAALDAICERGKGQEE
mgnify:CR=1 FL=1|jgi:large subunit ribosomal protein L4